MPTLDDALDQALGKPVSNPLITIDHTQKIFTLPQDFGKAGVRGDDNGRRIYFEMPFEMDEISPYSEHTTVEIQYRNAMGETGRYQVPKSEVMDNTNRNYTCSFPIPATLTKYEGEAEIQLCLRTDDGKKEWHISPVKVLIGPFFDCEVITEDDPKYDIVAQLMDKVTRLESVITGDEQISLMDYLTKTEAEQTYLKPADADHVGFSRIGTYYGTTRINPLFTNECLIVTKASWMGDMQFSIEMGTQTETVTASGETVTLRITQVKAPTYGPSDPVVDQLLIEASGGGCVMLQGTAGSLSIRLPERTTSHVFIR